MKSVFAALFTFFILAQYAFAGQGDGSFSGGGGGGTVAICTRPDGSISEIEVLDYLFRLKYTNGQYQKRQDLIRLDHPILILDRVLTEVSDRDAYLGSQLRKRLLELSRNTIFTGAISIDPFDLNFSIPATFKDKPFCKKGEKLTFRLVATQDFANKGLQIDSTIWNNPAFGAFQKAALLSHETWYSLYQELYSEHGLEFKPENIYIDVAEGFLEKTPSLR